MTQYKIHRDGELYHYGVPGTHWGIRRYQNLDGSYKPGAEGRYYKAVKKLPGGKQTLDSLTKKAAKFQEKYGSNSKSSESGGGGGGGGAKTTERPINKTVTGKDIEIHDVSEKTPQDKEAKKAAKSSSSSSSTAKSQTEFTINSLYDKIDNLFGMDEMTDEEWEEMELSDKDIEELDNMIKQYRASVTSKTKKTKKIDEFIERYEAWKNSHKRGNVEQSAMNDEEYLTHHGILGMHWGVRRYQNPDGSLTAEGKARYRKSFDSYYKSEKKYNATGSKKDYSQAKKESNEIRKNLEKDFKFTKKTMKAAQEGIQELKQYDRDHPQEAALFKSLTNNNPDMYNLLTYASRADYQEFLDVMDHEGMSSRWRTEDNGSVKGIYEYSKKQVDVNQKFVKTVSDMPIDAVKDMGYDPSSEEGKKVLAFIKNMYS